MTMVYAQKPVLVTGPVNTPVSRDEAKAHLRVDYTDDDTLIDRLISAATAYVDGWSGVLGQCLITQSWRQDFSGFPTTALRLPMTPVQSITTIKYRSDADVETTLSSDNYRLATDGQGAFVELIYGETWPTAGERADAVSVTAEYGYGDDATDVPEGIRHAMLLLIGHWYESREAVVVGAPVTDLPMAVDALLMPHRRVGV